MTEGIDSPVTVVVRRRVRAGREPDYEAWLEQLIAHASVLPGYLGTQVLRPHTDGSREYTSIFRFHSAEHLRAFETSDLRRRALEKVVDLVEADPMWEQMSGLEFWFTPPVGTVVPRPSPFRMALLLSAVVYVLVLSIGRLVGMTLAFAPASVRLLVTIVIEVFLMTYVLMPVLTRRLARFIYV